MKDCLGPRRPAARSTPATDSVGRVQNGVPPADPGTPGRHVLDSNANAVVFGMGSGGCSGFAHAPLRNCHSVEPAAGSTGWRTQTAPGETGLGSDISQPLVEQCLWRLRVPSCV